MNPIRHLIYEQYIDKIERNATSIGLEIELPLIAADKKPVELSFIKGLTRYAQNLGFAECNHTLDGFVCEMTDKKRNKLSFETTWNTLELSIKNARDLKTLSTELYRILIPLQRFCMERNYCLCGRGINPNYAVIDTSPLQTPILLAKSRYLKELTNHHDGESFHALCASLQTHLDAVDWQSYNRLFRFLRKAYVFEGLFFANSLPPDAAFIEKRPALKALATDTLCYRDELWRFCEAPNIQVKPGEIESVEDFCRYLEGLKLFIVPRGDGFAPIEPISLADYFAQAQHTAKSLACFRSLEPIAPTKAGSLEIRSTCVQPLDALLEPPAFYTGLSANLQQAQELVDAVYQRYFPGDTPLQVRDKLMKQSNESLRRQLKSSGAKLLELAVCGLKARGFGEETLLLPLQKRQQRDDFQMPAQYAEENAITQAAAQMREVGGLVPIVKTPAKILL